MLVSMKSRRVATFAEEGKWTSGADATMLVGDWQAWVDGEGHWKVRGPDPDNEAHYADGDIELTEAEYIEAGNSEARRKIRARRAKEAARAYIKTMTQSSKRHHATKKSPAQLQREIDEVLASPGSYSYEEAMAALEKKHAGVKRGGSLRSGHAPVAPKMPTSILQMLKDYKARVRFEDQLKRSNRDPDRPRWTAFVQNAFGHDAVGEGATKEAAARAAVTELPPHIRRHFEGV